MNWRAQLKIYIKAREKVEREKNTYIVSKSACVLEREREILRDFVCCCCSLLWFCSVHCSSSSSKSRSKKQRALNVSRIYIYPLPFHSSIDELHSHIHTYTNIYSCSRSFSNLVHTIISNSNSNNNNNKIIKCK